MKLLYVGGGFVGTCSAAVSADSGHDVLVYDINSDLIRKLATFNKEIIETALYEDGLGELLIRNKKRISFTNDLNDVKQMIDKTDAVFMCLPTPEKEGTGEADLTYYENACHELGLIMRARNGGEQKKYILIINKSTVPIYMFYKTKEILDEMNVKNFGIGSCPEFLVEGKAVEQSLKPNRIVVGAWEEQDFKIFRDIYKRFNESSTDVSYIEVNPVEAAASKLLANYILFNRLANCFDVVGRLCEKYKDLHFEKVRRVLTTDKRIGNWGFHDSLFAGGSCFIKDARSLQHHLKLAGIEGEMVKETLRSNFKQLHGFMSRPEKELQFDWSGKKVGLLGLAFKRDTNDIRNSAAIGVTEFLLNKQVGLIKAFDPVARANYFKYFSDRNKNDKIILLKDEADVIKDSDVLIITTDWPQFRELFDDIIELMPIGTLIMDGRRMLQTKYYELSEAGYNVIAVGSPMIKAK
jgi:UDPglucose 6-dehydrogenase